MTEIPIYGVGIVGLGSIGLNLDFGAPHRHIFSHTRASMRHRRTHLLWGVDPDTKARSRFADVSGKPTFATARDVPVSLRPDILVVSTPTNEREEALTITERLRPRLVLLEKPVASDYATAVRVVRGLRESGADIVVNYFRQFDPGLTELGHRIRNGDFGHLQRGNAYYTKGLYNNASHLIDLLNVWQGFPDHFRAIRNLPCPTIAADVNADFTLDYGEATVTFQALDERNFSLLELDLLFQNGRVRLHSSATKLEVSRPAPSDRYEGYVELKRSLSPVRLRLDRAQYNVLAAVVDGFDKGATWERECAAALATLRLCDQISIAAAEGD